MKQFVITLVLILVSVGMLAMVVSGSRQSQNKDDKELTTDTEKLEVQSDTTIFYYGNTCPHCHDVIDWMEANKIEEKFELIKKEVYDNRQNSAELTEVAKSCGIPTSSIGVPFLFAEGQCLVGVPDIEAYLSQKAELTNQ